MGRAFREGVLPERKIKFTVSSKRRYKLSDRLGYLSTIANRAEQSAYEQGPLVDVPALIIAENEEWIWQQVDEEVLDDLSHRLVLHSESTPPQSLGCTRDLGTAVALANHLAYDGKVILIEPLN